MNICSEVDPREIPDECDGKGSGGAFQVAQEYNVCYKLGGSKANYSLIDADDPTRGLSLTYSGGDACGSVDRTFRVDLVCKDKIANLPDRFDEFVHEYTNWVCHYSMELETIWGCPRECEIGLNTRGELALCSGNGVCAFDSHRGAPGCFCFGDWDGSDCSTVSTKTVKVEDNHMNAGMVFGVVFLKLGWT